MCECSCALPWSVVVPALRNTKYGQCFVAGTVTGRQAANRRFFQYWRGETSPLRHSRCLRASRRAPAHAHKRFNKFSAMVQETSANTAAAYQPFTQTRTDGVGKTENQSQREEPLPNASFVFYSQEVQTPASEAALTLRECSRERMRHATEKWNAAGASDCDVNEVENRCPHGPTGDDDFVRKNEKASPRFLSVRRLLPC